MKLLDTVLMIILLILLIGGIYFLWQGMPVQQSSFENYVANHPVNISLSQSQQFYQNMRFPDRKISYTIEPACNLDKEKDIIGALDILSNRTQLRFYNSDSGEITFVCSEIAPAPEQQGHFVAGEGGPTEIINTSDYAVIKKAKVSLFRDGKCDRPLVALHEILHALGFDHNNNPKSIMYPVSDCKQELDDSIVNSLNQLYISEPLPDLSIEEVEANASGRYINFRIIVGNNGLVMAKNSKLEIEANDKKIKEFDLENLDIGVKKRLSVDNLNAISNIKNITFIVSSDSAYELNSEDNKAVLSVR